MNDDQPTVPEELRTTYTMIRCAFPTDIPANAYFPLLAILCEAMSFRGAAETIALFLGGDYVQYLNDAYGARSSKAPEEPEVQRVKALLMPCGYHAWLDESA
jgi:hypothetical protein